MDSGPQPGDRTFVIRIRLEPRELTEAPPVWRGELIDVLTNERRCFTRPEELIGDLANRLGTSLLRIALAHWSPR